MSRRTQLFVRALSLRCPHCGNRGVFRHWLAMKESCPTCGLSLATGNRAGAYLFNFAAAELVLVVVFVTLVVRSWPNPPWNVLQYAAPLAMILTPLLFYPFSKLLFVALDLAMYPDAEPDIAVHGVQNTREGRREK